MVAVPTFVYVGDEQLIGGPVSTRPGTEGGDVFGGFSISSGFVGLGLMMPRFGRTVPHDPATGVMPASPAYQPYWDGSVETGTSTGAGASTLTVAGTPWDPGEWANVSGLRTVTINTGVGAGQTRTISSNTNNQLTVSVPWDTPPTASTFTINGSFTVYHHTNGRADKLFPGTAIVPGRRGDNWFEGPTGEDGAITPCTMLMQCLGERYGTAPPYFKFVKSASPNGVNQYGTGTAWTNGFISAVWNNAVAAMAVDGNTPDVKCLIIDASHRDIVAASLTYASDLQAWINLIRATSGFETCLILIVSHKHTMYGGIAAPVARTLNRTVAAANANVRVLDMNWGSFASNQFVQPFEPALAEWYDTPTYVEAGVRMFNAFVAWDTAAPSASPGQGLATYIVLTDSQGKAIESTEALYGSQASILGAFGTDIRPGQYIYNGDTEVVEFYDILANATTMPVPFNVFGPENTLLKALAVAHPEGVCVFKFAMNGAAVTSEAVTAGATGAFEEAANDLWPDIVSAWSTFRAAMLRDLDRVPDVLNVLLMVGDNEDGASGLPAAAFATKLPLWIDAIRELFTTRTTGDELPVTLVQPPKHITLGGQSGHGNPQARESVRATIASMPSVRPRCRVILSNAERYELQRHDGNVHYGTEATYALGYDAAEIFLEFEADEEGETEQSAEDFPSGAATFVVEDGSGLSLANSYCSVAFADAYFTDYGNPQAWFGKSMIEKQDALRIATRYLDDLYGASWKGIAILSTQALGWPRNGAYDETTYLIPSNEVPRKVKEAACEAAKRHLSGVVLLPDVAAEDQNLTSSSISVGPISISDSVAGTKATRPEFSVVTTRLRGLLRSRMGKLTR